LQNAVFHRIFKSALLCGQRTELELQNNLQIDTLGVKNMAQLKVEQQMEHGIGFKGRKFKTTTNETIAKCRLFGTHIM
jgi:hypothetical protein